MSSGRSARDGAVQMGNEEFSRAELRPGYGEDLLEYLRELSRAYQFFMEEKLKLHYDEELFTECIASMVVIMSHLLPKLEGGGIKTEKLYKEMCKFEPWIDDLMVPKLKERERVNDLWKLILKSYDTLGLSTL
jgi:hypothetical protein